MNKNEEMQEYLAKNLMRIARDNKEMLRRKRLLLANENKLFYNDIREQYRDYLKQYIINEMTRNIEVNYEDAIIFLEEKYG